MLRGRRIRGGRGGDGPDLSREELDWLKQYTMRLGRTAPPEVRDKFLAMGLIKQKLGGPGITDEGRRVLARKGR